MRRAAFPLILAGTFAVAALGAHTVGSNAGPTRIVDVDHDDPLETPSATETPEPSATPDAPSSSPSSDDGPSASSTPDAPDDSDGRSDDDDNSGHGGGDEDRSGSNSGKG